jgi:MFS family permease
VPTLTEGNRKWWILATMTGTLSMILIDETVSVALPTIERDLGMSQTALQCVVNGCCSRSPPSSPSAGGSGEMLGQARMFKLGAVVFIASSAACGLA